eukprot:6473732-Amphidinium_carterae.1
MKKVPVSSLGSRVRCWRCGQMGHMSKQCPQSSAGGAGPSQSNYFEASESPADPGFFDLDFVTLPVTKSDIDRYDSYFVIKEHWGIPDTGALHALVGANSFMSMEQRLETMGLTSIPAEPPQAIGGIGGGVEVIAGAKVPVGIAGRPGILSFTIIPGNIPPLVPLPVLRALKGCVRVAEQRIDWQHGSSTLEVLPSGHLACSLLDGLELFIPKHPESYRYRRQEHDPPHVVKIKQSIIKSKPKHVQFFDITESAAVSAQDGGLPQTDSRAAAQPAVATESESECVHHHRSRSMRVMEAYDSACAENVAGCSLSGCDTGAVCVERGTAAEVGGFPTFTSGGGPTGCDLGKGTVTALAIRQTPGDWRLPSRAVPDEREQILQMVGLQDLPDEVAQDGERDHGDRLDTLLQLYDQDWSLVSHTEQLQLWSSSCHMEVERSNVVALPSTVSLQRDSLQQQGYTGEYTVIGKDSHGRPVEMDNHVPQDLQTGIALLQLPGECRPVMCHPHASDVPPLLCHLEACEHVRGCCEVPIADGVVVCHPPSDSKLSDESLMTYESKPYRVSVCLQTGPKCDKDDNIAEQQQGPWSVELDSWLLK